MGTLLIFLNFYWIYPLFKLGTGDISSSVSSLGLLSLINPLLLFSPHWPANIFGKISYPPFYFVLVPITIFSGLILNKDKKYINFGLLFLFFAFLTKGKSAPLGINLGYIFRDSSKFFIPVVLFAGFLIGNTLDLLKNNYLKLIGFLYILFLISPVFFGKMNFMMSGNTSDNSYLEISKEISSQNQEFRTLWFTNKNPLSYESKSNPAIDASSLVSFSPFAQINESEDAFNFLNNNSYIDWLRVLGVKYVFLNGDARNINPTETDIKNWETIKKLVDNSFNNKKYEITNPYPKFYAVDSLVAVVGSSYPLREKSFVPTIYFEDGKWDPSTIYEKKPNSLKIYFTDGNKTDLAMSFLQKYFVSPGQNTSTQWSVFPTNQYLKAKYELLIRGVTYKDFDYQKGIAFSTKDGEEIKFELNIPEEGNYLLLVRMMTNKDSQGLENANTQNIFDTGTVKRDNFVWLSEELKDLKRGQQKVTIKNRGGLTVLNTLALIPKAEFAKAQTLSETFLTNFGVVNTKQLENETNKIIPAVMEKFGTLNYKFTTLEENHWLIMNENYHPFWQLRRGIEYFDSIPLYSMVNAFYVESTWCNTGIEFIGQKNVRWGMYLTVVFGLVLTIYYLLKKSNYEN